MGENTQDLAQLKEKATKMVEQSPTCARDTARKQGFLELVGKVDEVKALSEFVAILEREQADWKQMAEKAMERLKVIEKKYKARIKGLQRKAMRDIRGFREEGEQGESEAKASGMLKDL